MHGMKVLSNGLIKMITENEVYLHKFRLACAAKLASRSWDVFHITLITCKLVALKK